MFKFSKIAGLLLLSLGLSTQASAAMISLNGTGPTFNLDLVTNGVNDITSISGTFSGKTVTGLSTFNPTGSTTDFFNSATDFDFSFLVNPIYGTSLSDSVRIFSTVSGPLYQIGAISVDYGQGPLDNHVAFPDPQQADGEAFTTFNANVPVVDAVPEPATYAMFLAGLGLLGFAARRKA